MNQGLNAVTGMLNAKGLKVSGNRGPTRFVNGYDSWMALDSMPTPPDMVLEEGALAIKYGSGDIQFYNEEQWRRQVDILKNINRSDVCFLTHSDLRDWNADGTDNYGKPFMLEDALYYVLASYLLGRKDNSFIEFLDGVDYNSIDTYFPEYDKIELGRALGEYKVMSIGGRNIYWREFEKGYAYVNPSPGDVEGITLPEACRQLTHSNLDDQQSISLINSISLRSHRGAILLKGTSPDIEAYRVFKGTALVDGDISEYVQLDNISVVGPQASGDYWMLWDEDYLYMAAEILDSQLAFDISHQNDGNLWLDDSVELMLDTLGEGGSSMQPDDYKFFVNVVGVQADSKASDMAWDSGFTAAVVSFGEINTAGSDTGYIAEMAIPFAALGITPSAGTIMGLVIVLDDRNDAGATDQTAWSNKDRGNINSPDGWGRIVLSADKSCIAADSDCNGCISLTELSGYLNRWKSDQATMMQLMSVIRLWKDGC